MENKICDNGGCIITWNVENLQCLKPYISSHSSPLFKVETNKYSVWKLRLFTLDSHQSLWLDRDDGDSSISISYSCFWKSNYAQKQNSGLLTFAKHDNFRILHQFYTLENTFTTSLTVHCYLRVIGDIDSVTRKYKFRSIIEVEHLKFKYDIPNISTWKVNDKLIIPLPKTNNEPELFKITVSGLASKCNNLQRACVEFCSTKTAADFKSILGCKLTVFDEEMNAINSMIHHHSFTNKNKNWLFPDNISIKTTNKNSSKDVLTLDFELWITEHKTTTWMEDFTTINNQQIKANFKKSEKEKINLRDDLMCLYMEQKVPDVEICVGGKNFPAHKAILSARSPVFMAMFENHMLEKEKNMVEISDMCSETVDKMLFFMYSEILQTQDWDEVTKLYAAADKYQIMSLKDKCSEILKEQLSSKNIFEALILADLHCDTEFLKAAQTFIISNDVRVMHSEKWIKFMNTNSKIACQVMHKAWLCSKNLSDSDI